MLTVVVVKGEEDYHPLSRLRKEVILLHLIDSFDVAFLPAIVANYLNDFLIARPLRGCDMRLTFSFCYLKSSRNPSLHALGTELQQKYAMLD